MILNMLENNSFWNHLDSTQQSLVKQSFFLLDFTKKTKQKFIDYSFILMPAAKAFEGFLKKLFFEKTLISSNDFKNDYFRLGKALNPELKDKINYNSLYPKIRNIYGQDTADFLWLTWRNCRNRVFHYFSQEQKTFSLEETEARLNQIIKAISLLVSKN